MTAKKKLSPVFIYASILVLILVIVGMIMPERFGDLTGALSSFITATFGWYYMILVTVIILFSIFLIFSPIGKLKLGKPNDEPEFKTISWLAMLFSAGMGIGLVFYGASEPISHYLMPPSTDPETKKRSIYGIDAFNDFPLRISPMGGIRNCCIITFIFPI